MDLLFQQYEKVRNDLVELQTEHEALKELLKSSTQVSLGNDDTSNGYSMFRPNKFDKSRRVQVENSINKQSGNKPVEWSMGEIQLCSGCRKLFDIRKFPESKVDDNFGAVTHRRNRLSAQLVNGGFRGKPRPIIGKKTGGEVKFKLAERRSCHHLLNINITSNKAESPYPVSTLHPNSVVPFLPYVNNKSRQTKSEALPEKSHSLYDIVYTTV
ncbi:hypothetical protein J6590_085195 [Homalodisca vitripennis]|nr:hypothetical protein J6590_085195 [Homalodisca vitripennis]